MGCINEWGTTVSGNVSVSGMHIYAFNRFDDVKYLDKKKFREFPFL